MIFHPEWGCLAPAANVMRTVRTVLIATVIGATAGGGMVSAWVDRSAGAQTSVAGRTMVRVAVPTSVAAAQTAQLSPHISDQNRVGQALCPDSHGTAPAANELSADSTAPAMIVVASDEVGMDSVRASVRTPVAPSSTLHARHKSIAPKASHKAVQSLHKTVLSSWRQTHHSLQARIEPNAFQTLVAGLTVAMKHVWPLATSTANATTRAHGNKVSATT
jgi:hypothetical protein